ncbi:hypothetical protein CAPTEDRAFT_218483 [Capitella teleta]|uniref:Uncharacterized protein n=1 Tax=Capitella teleta TaxID=283909 RepID=R7VMF6_CAPTE|nr:hypothetical protein CAPTEDRAFT_218483 [Capitella teleta]|eukprot:ELU18755.1 hypothetical protein CAPTEDRAFT_218483 [Capitella teleta]
MTDKELITSWQAVLFLNDMFAKPLKNIAEDHQVKYLLLWAVREGRQIADSWILTKDEKKKLKQYWDRLKKQVQPKSNLRGVRFKRSIYAYYYMHVYTFCPKMKSPYEYRPIFQGATFLFKYLHTDLVKQSSEIVWDEQVQKAFDDMKNSISHLEEDSELLYCKRVNLLHLQAKHLRM